MVPETQTAPRAAVAAVALVAKGETAEMEPTSVQRMDRAVGQGLAMVYAVSESHLEELAVFMVGAVGRAATMAAATQHLGEMAGRPLSS